MSQSSWERPPKDDVNCLELLWNFSERTTSQRWCGQGSPRTKAQPRTGPGVPCRSCRGTPTCPAGSRSCVVASAQVLGHLPSKFPSLPLSSSSLSPVKQQRLAVALSVCPWRKLRPLWGPAPSFGVSSCGVGKPILAVGLGPQPPTQGEVPEVECGKQGGCLLCSLGSTDSTDAPTGVSAL